MTGKTKIALLILGGLIIYSYSQRKNDTPKIHYVNWLPFSYNALTIPPFGIFILKEQAENPELTIHELVHWKQFQREGLGRFLLGYSLQNVSNGYDGNIYEVEARFNETDFCKTNYTYCVQNGIAKTVQNTTFRT